MRDGICPKCGSHGVYRGPKGFAEHKEGNFIATGFLSVVRVTRYICTSCGFIEDYLEKPADRDAVKDAFDKVSPHRADIVVNENPADTINCLSCGLPMQPDATTCFACGWTWEAEAPKNE